MFLGMLLRECYAVELGAYNITYVPRNEVPMNFPSTNNEAKYEALLAGLRIAEKIKVRALKVMADSKLEEEDIPRNQNQKADVLSKLASVAFNHLTKEVLVEVLNTKSVDVQEVNMIVEEEEDNWMIPIIKCLEEGVWPTEENEARTLRMKISQYVIEEGILFKKSYLSPMLRCVEPLQAIYIIREVHKGACGMHAGARSVIHAPVPRLSKTRLTSIMSIWAFYQWGLDMLGPLLEGHSKLKFIIVAIDYFTKWMKAKPLAKTTGKEAILGWKRVGWLDELPNILWAHRTMLKTSIGETPFSLTYGSEAVIPVEIGMPTYLTIQFNEAQNKEEMRLNLNLIQERRETTAIREAKYKKKVEQYHNKQVRPVSFKVRDFVYRRNEAS
ncbi:reverse transcriptase domain-containing protein [Tanacetum coccineum]